MDLAVSVNEKGERWIKHYSSSHSILLVGEGDFSFSACLAKAFGSAVNMVATSLDSEELLKIKHPTAEANLKQLNDLGCIVLHGVDASTMSCDPRLIFKLFHRIVFNFPHAGFSFREDNFFQILATREWTEKNTLYIVYRKEYGRSHQEVVKHFLRSARDLMSVNGEVHVTHKTAYPFSKWEIEKLGEEVGLRLVEKACFTKWDYPGYDNKRGDGARSNETFPVGQCCTFKFAFC